jgi:hypothetical protein
VQYEVLASTQAIEITNKFHKDLLNLLETRGLPFMVSQVKSWRNQIMAYVLSKPLIGDPGLDKDGFPVRLTYLKHLSLDPQGVRALLTLLTLTRAFHLSASPDLDTITQPWSGTDTISGLELGIAFKVLKIQRGMVEEWNALHTTTKRGPIGQALLSSLSELTLLPSTLVDNIKLLGGNSLSNMIDENIEGLDILEVIKPKGWTKGYFSISWWWRTLFPTKRNIFRKLSYFPDKEGKTRVIAILDYWSQTCLKPLHNSINRILRGIYSDCTFDQNSFTRKTPQILHGNSYHSIDLSAATDRMPIKLQKRLVSFLFNSEQKANAWYDILVGQPYSINISNRVISVVYGAGQPMGAYSSWPVMALTHHIIVQVAALRAGLISTKRPIAFKGYVLLGDDLRIDHDLVSKEYLNLLSQLAMPYSAAKTHVSEHGFEFAKRWYAFNTEVTGFSISGLLSVWKRYPLLINFLDNQASHGWTLPEGGHPGLILSLHRTLYGQNFIINKALSMIKLYEVFYIVRWFRKSPSLVIDNLSRLILLLDGFIKDGKSPIAQGPFTKDPQKTICLVYLRAKRNLVEKDLYSFQTEAYKVNSKLWGFVKDKVTEARVDQATASFLRETLSVVLNWNNPVVHILNRQIDSATNFLMKYWDPDISDNFLFEVGLSKYNLTKGTLSMRSSTSIMLAESAILKEFISVYVNLQNSESDDYTSILERLSELEQN